MAVDPEVAAQLQKLYGFLISKANVDHTHSETTRITFTNKTVDLSDNTLTGTVAEFNAALSDDDFATFSDVTTAAAKNPDLLVTGAITLDSDDLITSAAVVWPDGTPGTLTITSRDANSSVLAYNITYGSPATKTYTQPTITRNANGAATNVPAIVVT